MELKDGYLIKWWKQLKKKFDTIKNEGTKCQRLLLLIFMFMFMLIIPVAFVVVVFILCRSDFSIPSIYEWLIYIAIFIAGIFAIIDTVDVIIKSDKIRKPVIEKFPQIYFFVGVISVPVIIVVGLFFWGVLIIVRFPAVIIGNILKLLPKTIPFLRWIWEILKPLFGYLLIQSILYLNMIDIKLFRNRIVHEMRQILYDYESKLPTKKPIAITDITITFPKDDNSIVILETVKKSNAKLTKEETEDAETIMRSFFEMRLYPKTQNGDVMPNIFTANGITLFVDRCEDSGIYFRTIIKVARENNSLFYKICLKVAELLKIDIPNNTSAKNKAIATPKDDTL